MVKKGEADGMVAGAVNSTANTLRPALQILKTAPGTKSYHPFLLWLYLYMPIAAWWKIRMQTSFLKLQYLHPNLLRCWLEQNLRWQCFLILLTAVPKVS